jgi:CHAD domain-containing protein
VGELELEVKSGPMAPAYRLALELLEHSALCLGVESKADRGFRLLTDDTAPPVKSRAAPVPRAATLEEALICTAGAALHDFVSNLPSAGAGNVEGVHQLRVALRRLRSMLVFYAPFLESCASDRFSDAIRDLGRVLGAARDWDVFVEETLEAAKADGVQREWAETFAEEAAAHREAAHRAVRDLLDGKAPAELVLGLQSWLVGTEWAGHESRSATKTIDKIMPGLFERLARKVERRGRGIGDLSPAGLHPLRKSIKKMRYSSESAAGLYGEKSVKRYAKRCKKLQALLGAINDAQVTMRLAEQIAPPHSAAWAPAFGTLHEWNSRRMKASRKDLRRTWQRLRDATVFWD